MREDIKEILFDEKQIQHRVQEIGAEICGDFRGSDLVLVSVLRGAIMFVGDLMRAIDIPLTVDFMAITGYGPAVRSKGVVKIVKDLDEDITGRPVLVVEDVIDTGLTLAYLLRYLRSKGPATVDVCTLLDRRTRRLVDIPVRYRGFEVGDVFVVGYGLDYGQRYRNLPFIGVLKDDIQANGKSG